MREAVVKDLAGARKTTKLAGIAVETHQAAILAATLVGYAVFCYYLAGFFGLSTERAAILLSPIAPLAILFAFYRSPGGYHLDFLVERKLLTLLRPSLFFKRARNHVSGEPVSMRDAIQNLLPTEEFHWEMLRLRGGTYVVVFRVIPRNLSMIGDTERMRVFRAATDLYNALDFPWVEITRSKPGSTARYARRFRATVAEKIPPEWRKLRSFAADHAGYLERKLPALSIFERKGYAVLYYNPDQERAGGKSGASNPVGMLSGLLKTGGIGGRPSRKDARKRQEEADAARRVLLTRARSFHNLMARLGCRIEALTDLELDAFIRSQLGDFDEDSDALPNLYSPVSLEPGGYEKLSEKKREKLIMEAESHRTSGPNALGIGDWVTDAIAPDCVRIAPDHLEVDGRFHTTMFVSGWPDEVFFGMLSDLGRIEGRVKVVKYIEPRPKKEAQTILGGRVAALRASRRTAADGNVNSEQQREIAEYTNEQALHEINSGRQRYLELSVLVHLEAESLDDLYAMSREVQDILAGWRVETKLAREQTWEGLLSSLPFGRNYLAERYCSFGMLSRPTACLLTYGGQQLDHENGAFVGVDARSNAVMTLDTRRLVNPHGVILGQSGAGKSFVIKCLSTRYLMAGHRQVIIDPEGNSRYVRVARSIGGAYAVIAPGSKHKINPFDLHEDYMNLDLLEDIFGDEDETEGAEAEEAYRAARSSALDGKAQEITRMVSLMAATDESGSSGGAVGGLSGGEASFIERAVYEAYERRGIMADPTTHSRPAPIFPEFWDILNVYAKENEIVAGLLEKLWSWHSGALSKIFDAPTNVDLSNRYLVFQISKVKNRQKAPVMHAILEFLNGVLSNPNEPSDCWIDEGWALLAYPMSAEFAEMMYRSGRARDNAMWLASQAINEFVGSSQGDVILKLAATHMIFRHEHQMSARATAAVHDLSDEETEELINFQRGEGYLIVDQARIPMVVMASEAEEELYNTDPRLEAKYRSGRNPDKRPSLNPLDSNSIDEQATRPVNPATRMQTYAFSGDGASETAAAMVRMLGREARRQGKHVLAVDACGGALSESLGVPQDAEERRSDSHLDEFLSRNRVDAEALGEHLKRSAAPSVWCAEPPQDSSLPSFALKETASEIFDVCIVACPGPDQGNFYAEDWLLGADAVVGCSSSDEDGALRSALTAEELRGKNGTLLAVSGSKAGGREPDSERRGRPHSRPVHRLSMSSSGDISPNRSLKELALALTNATSGQGDDDA